MIAIKQQYPFIFDPLLQVLMLTYHGTSVRALPHRQVQLQEQIWADYVQRMVSRKGDAKRYPFTVTTTWLGWLARQMRTHNQTIFLLEQFQPDWLPPKQRSLYRWSVGLLVGLLAGQRAKLLDGLSTKQLTERPALSPNEGIRRSLKNGLLVALLVALLSGLFAGLPGGLGAAMQHSLLRCWLRHTFPLRAVPFLEDATMRILLRRVGGGYRFAHRLLLDYSADLDPHPSSPPSSLPTCTP